MENLVDRADRCPYCGAALAADAVRCPSCGEDLAAEDERPWERSRQRQTRRDAEPHRGVLILVLGILSLILTVVGLPLGITAWLLGQRDLRKMTAGAMDREGEGLTQAGRICGIIGTFWQELALMACFAYLGFFVYIVTVAARPRTPAATPVPPPAAPAPPARPAPAPAPDAP